MVEDLIGKGKAAGLESRAEDFIHSATRSHEGFCAGADLIQTGKREQVQAAWVQGEPGGEEGAGGAAPAAQPAQLSHEGHMVKGHGTLGSEVTAGDLQ